MLCIPKESFQFYNVAGAQNKNSISLIFEQCGGKFAKEKEFQEVLELQKQDAIAAGIDPEDIIEDTWEWTAPDCDPEVEDCGFGLSEPVLEESIDASVLPALRTYEDCDLTQASTDIDCVEYWDIPCDAPEYACF